MYAHHRESRRRETCRNPKCNRGEDGGRKVFEVGPSAPPRKFCSRTCKAQFDRRRERRGCAHCGEPFSCLRSSVQRYCTRKCYRAAVPFAAGEILSAHEAGLRGPHHFKNNLGVGLKTVYDVLQPAKPGTDDCSGDCGWQSCWVRLGLPSVNSLGWAVAGSSWRKPKGGHLADDELIDRYMEHLRWRGREKSLPTYVGPVRMLSRSSSSGLGTVTTEDVARLVDEHRHTPDQRHRYALLLDGFYVWGRDAGLLPSNPAEPIARP